MDSLAQGRLELVLMMQCFGQTVSSLLTLLLLPLTVLLLLPLTVLLLLPLTMLLLLPLTVLLLPLTMLLLLQLTVLLLLPLTALFSLVSFPGSESLNLHRACPGLCAIWLQPQRPLCLEK